MSEGAGGLAGWTWGQALTSFLFLLIMGWPRSQLWCQGEGGGHTGQGPGVHPESDKVNPGRAGARGAFTI